jgi:hypothetical protein
MWHPHLLLSEIKHAMFIFHPAGAAGAVATSACSFLVESNTVPSQSLAHLILVQGPSSLVNAASVVLEPIRLVQVGFALI